MNDAKALLESIARNYGSRLASRGIRVNTVSQAPTKTSAGSGIKTLTECLLLPKNYHRLATQQRMNVPIIA